MREDLNLVTFRQVQDRVAAIGAMLRDNESAHAAEDDLWQDVLYTIANGHDEPELLARAALETRKFDYARWYA